MERKFSYGGQAVIEGVMIRGQKAMVTAVRRPSGGIAVKEQKISPIFSGRLRKIPFVRGIIVLIEAMVLGISSLIYSANISLEEEEEQISQKSIWGMIAVALVLAVGLFFMAPLFLTRLANPLIDSSLLFHIIEGVVRLAIFILYLKVLSFIPDIKRVFSYHGAEHKSVNGYEAGVPLEVDSIKKYGTAHMRCGTSFLFAVLIIAIVVFAIIGRQELWLMILSRVLLLPVIAALGYEVTQYGARHHENFFIKIIMSPGLLLQSLTTDEPDDEQLKVAIAAMQKAIEIDKMEEAPAS